MIAQRSASRQADALRQGAAYQPLPLVRRGGEDALPMPGGEISGAEGAQAAINGVRRKYRVTDRKDTADGETGGFPHSVGRGLFDFAGKTEGGGNDRLVAAPPVRGQRDRWLAAPSRALRAISARTTTSAVEPALFGPDRTR